jgi:hypothetical protein
MNVLKRGFVATWLLGARLAIAADAPAAARVAPPPTAVPVVGVSQAPLGDVFKSWTDYRYELDMESELPGASDKFSGVNVISIETHIRRADTGQEVARIPFQGAIGPELYDERPGHIEFLADMKTYPARNSSLTGDAVKEMDKSPPGDYLLAVYVNGVRASNVVKVRIDPAYDVAKAPTLQLAGLEPDPRAQYGLVYFWIIGPNPVDPVLQTRFLSYSFTVDGVAKQFDLGEGSGPPGHALASGERKVVFLNGHNGWAGRDPFYDGSQMHTFTVSISGAATRGLLGENLSFPSTKTSHYEAGPFTFAPKVHPLGDAWDQTSPPDEKRPIAPPAPAPSAGTGIPPPPNAEF